MNILPKKNWHVRNRDNIERVKRDEARAAEEEKKQLERAAVAEREARTKLLRERAQAKGAIDFVGSEVVAVDGSTSHHVNFFSDLEKQTKKVNKDHEAEKKAEQEAWEKKVGILTQLGQSVIEGQVKTLVDGHRIQPPDVDPDVKRKESMDPLKLMREYMGHKENSNDLKSRKRKYEQTQGSASSRHDKAEPASKLAYQSHISKSHSSSHKKRREDKESRKRHKRKQKHKHRKHKKDKERNSNSNKEPLKNLEQMRAERIRRENEERKRAEQLLSGKIETTVSEVMLTDALDGRYNSQFHPHLSRQRRSKDFLV